jgi:hypothetical protein
MGLRRSNRAGPTVPKPHAWRALSFAGEIELKTLPMSFAHREDGNLNQAPAAGGRRRTS